MHSTGPDNLNIYAHDSIAIKYDKYYRTKTGRAIDCLEKEAISAFLARIPRGELLELGCGTGHWTEFFTQSGFQVTATDASDAMLAIAKSRNLPQATFQKADAADLPFPDSSFGTIATITMLEFVKDRAVVFREIDRVLKPGGWLFIGSLNAASELGKTKDRHKTLKHANFLTVEELAGHLSHFGTPMIKQCVHMTSLFEILDNTPLQSTVEGAFIAACVQKVK